MGSFDLPNIFLLYYLVTNIEGYSYSANSDMINTYDSYLSQF